MSTLAHPRLTTPGTTTAPHTDRVPLYQAIEAAGSTVPWWRERFRRPFARRRPTVRSLIRRHHLRPAMEFAYDSLVEEFGEVRVRVAVAGEEERFPYVRFDVTAPGVEMDRLLEFEEELSTRVTERFGRAVSLRILITMHFDPDYLPLFA